MSLIVSNRYSKALLEAFADAGKIDELTEEVEALIEIIDQTNLMTFILDNSYAQSKKEALINSLGENFSKELANFLKLLIVNKRISSLEEILKQTLLKIDDLKGIAEVEVISAVPLTSGQLEKVRAIAIKKFNLKDVEIVNSLDQKIIGGMVLKSRGKIIDSSIKAQLLKLTQEIM
ncbi:F0F1 ATP synthase subunit delta [Streptococcaceae bacterium ESL0729]|nr:F0F1 ATP synthase subunit delta [Streptococcaceae bacterium ESL0729]